MSFWRRLGHSREQLEAAALRRRVTSLEAALAGHEAAAARTRWRHVRAAVAGILLFGLGFAVGGYAAAPLQQVAADWAAALGLGRSISRHDPGHAAYEQGDYRTALQLLRPRAERGDAQAQAALGEMYYHGRGVPRNDAEAVKLFRLAANQGNAVAQLHLGVAYADGHGVPQDHAEAVRWYRLAADQREPQAMYNLALAYARGEGIRRDNINAHVWFNLAAAHFPASDARNRNLAVSNRDVVAARMSPGELAQAERLAREWKLN